VLLRLVGGRKKSCGARLERRVGGRREACAKTWQINAHELIMGALNGVCSLQEIQRPEPLPLPLRHQEGFLHKQAPCKPSKKASSTLGDLILISGIPTSDLLRRRQHHGPLSAGVAPDSTHSAPNTMLCYKRQFQIKARNQTGGTHSKKRCLLNQRQHRTANLMAPRSALASDRLSVTDTTASLSPGIECCAVCPGGRRNEIKMHHAC
jgi:hypothetical protein